MPLYIIFFFFFFFCIINFLCIFIHYQISRFYNFNNFFLEVSTSFTIQKETSDFVKGQQKKKKKNNNNTQGDEGRRWSLVCCCDSQVGIMRRKNIVVNSERTRCR